MERELQNLERERIHWYKDYLKTELDRSKELKKSTNSYINKKNQKSPNQLIDILKKQDEKRIHDRRQHQYYLKQHNNELVKMRRSGIYFEQPQLNDNSKSFFSKISQQDQQRIISQNYEHKFSNQINSKQTDLKRSHEKRMRSAEKFEEFHHLKTMKKLDQMRRRQYSTHLKKHSQNMKLYHQHQELIHQNQNYRNQLENFTKTPKDILSKLYRNEYSERRQKTIENQELVKKQIEETKNKKKVNDRQQIKNESKFETSFLKPLLKDRPDHRKEHAQFLTKQIGEKMIQKNIEKQYEKEKYSVNGIFGGQHGRERLRMLKYVDDKMGIRPKNQNSASQNLTSQKLEKQKQVVKVSRQKTPGERSRKSSSQNSEGIIHQMKKEKPQIPQPTKNAYRSYDLVAGQTRYFNQV